MSELAILGGSPVRTAPWPHWPERGEREVQAVAAAVADGDWGGFPLPGPHTERFTSAFCKRCDSRFGLAVANGSVSLEIALMALGVPPGAEVIVPAYTFEATASAVLFAGCRPIFADVLGSNGCLDPEALQNAITSKTEAVVPVHLAMQIADMDRIGEIAQKHGLAVLEDCAHAHGARWRDKGVGSLGHAGSFSFQSSKLLTAGEGGIVTTDDEGVYDRCYALANCGRTPGAEPLAEPTPGHNYRMTEIQAALLGAQLERLDEQSGRRQKNAQLLEEGLREVPGVTLMPDDPRVTERAIYQYVFHWQPEEMELPRDVLVAALAAEGVPADGRFYEAVPYSPLWSGQHLRQPQLAFDQPPRGSFPAAERLAYETTVWLPHWLLLGESEDVGDLLAAIHKVVDRRSELADLDASTLAGLTQARATRRT